MLKQLVRALGFAAVLAVLAPSPALAQGEGDVEVFAGGSFFNLNLPLDQNVSDNENLKMFGIHGSLTIYMSDKLGIVLDGFFPRGDTTIPSAVGNLTFRLSQSTYLGGVQYRFSSRTKSRASLQVMLGWHTGTISSVQIAGIDQPFLVGLGESGVAAAVGVNFDMDLGSSFALRLLHAGMVWTGYQGATQASPRVSIGLVRRF